VFVVSQVLSKSYFDSFDTIQLCCESHQSCSQTLFCLAMTYDTIQLNYDSYALIRFKEFFQTLDSTHLITLPMCLAWIYLSWSLFICVGRAYFFFFLFKLVNSYLSNVWYFPFVIVIDFEEYELYPFFKRAYKKQYSIL